MKILGIESSCDETAAAIVENGRSIMSNTIRSQIDIHKEYGGVVPEIAARSHIEAILPVIKETLKKASLGWDDIDAIAVTKGPGLVGSLLIGTLVARTLAYVHKKPLYPIHHVQAHVYANFLLPNIPVFPILSLIVSGKHSQLVLFASHEKYQILGETQDDAVGEAFDKVAKIIGLPYPGGPSVAHAALDGDSTKYLLPKAKLQNPYDFSFSGLKTALLRAVQREVGVDITFPSHKLSERLTGSQQNDFAASFQHTAIETLVDKTVKAYGEYKPKSVVIAGGVGANQELRRQLATRIPIKIEYPPIDLCTDNAAMIAAMGYYYAQHHSPTSPFDMVVLPSVSM